MTRRSPENCPLRYDVRKEGDQEYARCRLVTEIVGSDQFQSVHRSACEHCCRGHEPTQDRANEVIASHVYTSSLAIDKAGGTEGCDVARAQAKQTWAISYLRWVQRKEESRVPPYAGPCQHLGDPSGEMLDCATCKGNVRLKVFHCRHLMHDTTTVPRCRDCDDYEPPLTVGKVRKWMVGLATSPREEPTLTETLASLSEAGWDDVTIFAEPESPLPKGYSSIVQRIEKRGAWPNFLLGLLELHAADPAADAYFMVQDDAVFCRGTRAYLEETLWPGAKVGVVSLHTPMHQANPEARGFFAADVGWGAWGAMGFVFPNVAARYLLADPRVMNHRNRGMGTGQCNVDSVVGDWCRRAGFPFYLHSPSLCQHTGLTSTLWQGATLEGRRRSVDFPGQEVDIREWMKDNSAP